MLQGRGRGSDLPILHVLLVESRGFILGGPFQRGFLFQNVVDLIDVAEVEIAGGMLCRAIVGQAALMQDGHQIAELDILKILFDMAWSFPMYSAKSFADVRSSLAACMMLSTITGRVGICVFLLRTKSSILFFISMGKVTQ